MKIYNYKEKEFLCHFFLANDDKNIASFKNKFYQHGNALWNVEKNENLVHFLAQEATFYGESSYYAHFDYMKVDLHHLDYNGRNILFKMRHWQTASGRIMEVIKTLDLNYDHKDHAGKPFTFNLLALPANAENNQNYLNSVLHHAVHYYNTFPQHLNMAPALQQEFMTQWQTFKDTASGFDFKNDIIMMKEFEGNISQLNSIFSYWQLQHSLPATNSIKKNKI